MKISYKSKKIVGKTIKFLRRNIIRKKVPPSIFFSNNRINLGDSMVPWLIECITKKSYPYSDPNENIGSHLLSIGSILQYANNSCDVWGSGFISVNSKVISTPKSISATRGPLTSSRLESLGIVHKKIYGDPALLTSRYINNKWLPKSGQIGLIPHYADIDIARKIKLASAHNLKLIDIQTDNIGNFCNSLFDCDFIVSSSLHGIIIAESFGIPAIWCQLSNNVVGDGFKFNDYFKGTGRDITFIDPNNLLKSTLTLPKIKTIKKLETFQDNLLEAFPGNYL